MAVQSDTRRRLYHRIKDDMAKSPTQTVRVTDYTAEFSEYMEFPSGSHHVNKMTPLLAYLAKPQSHGVRIDMGFTITDIDGIKYGAVLRTGPGKYRWFPQAQWADDHTIYIQGANKYQVCLSGIVNLRKYNKGILFIDRPSPKTDRLTDKFPTYTDPGIQSWTIKHKDGWAKSPYPKPDPATKVNVIPVPPSPITHYGTPGKVMAPLAEVIHHEGDTLIVKVDGKVLVCRVETEVG